MGDQKRRLRAPFLFFLWICWDRLKNYVGAILMKIKSWLIGLATLILVLLMAPLLIPMESYTKQLEQMASDNLGDTC